MAATRSGASVVWCQRDSRVSGPIDHRASGRNFLGFELRIRADDQGLFAFALAGVVPSPVNRAWSPAIAPRSVALGVQGTSQLLEHRASFFESPCCGQGHTLIAHDFLPVRAG